MTRSPFADTICPYMSIVTTTYIRLRGGKRGVVDMRVRGGDLTGRKLDSLVAHDDTMDLGHDPPQRTHRPKREPVARGPRGSEERHDEAKGVE